MFEIDSILKESNGKYQFLINNILDVIAEIDLDGTFTYISPRVYDIFGYKPEEIIGNQFFSYIHPDDMPKIMETFKKAVAGEKIISLEYRVRHKEGHYISVCAKGSLVQINKRAKILGVLRDITRRKLAEEKLKESEVQFREITEQSFMGICIIQDSKIKYINQIITNMLGYSAKEIQNWSMKDFFNVVHPQDKQLAINRLSRRQKGIVDEQHSQIYRVFTKTGELKWMDIYSKIIQYEGHHAILATLIEVSEKKKAELELEKEREKIQLYLDLAGVIIIALNSEGEITMINKKGCDVLEYKEEELIGKNWFLTCLPDTMKNDVYEVFKRLMRGKIETTEFYENAVLTKSGKEKIIAWHNTLLYDDNRNIMGTLSSGEDITERKNAENLLKQSEEKYRMIFTGASDAIAIMDDIKFVDCNDITVNLFGYDDKSEMIGIHPWNISPQKQPDGKDSVEKARELIKRAILGEPQRFYWKHLKKDGSLFDAEISLSSFKLENKNYIMAIIRDITERKKAERELQEISNLKTELLERTSHELKTPLISIKGFTDLLLDLHKEKFDDEVFSILEEIKYGTEQLQTLINRLLETSLLESEQIIFNPKEEDLSFLIRFCVKNLRGLAKTRNHYITIDIPDKLILNFEKERIYDVFSHLIINAIKYSPPFGEINITAKKKENFAYVCVQDNGIGLSEDDKKKIFKQFGKIERYGQGWDIGIEGTGMGLFNAKKIVELHGGKIWVESEGRNKGSKFCFTIPFNKE
ncbi:MAG: PAS domain S-box protein [Promethearchaeota archaeon]